MKKVLIVSVISVAIMFCVSAVCSAVDTTKAEQETTTTVVDYDKEALNHLENIELFTKESFKWIYAGCASNFNSHYYIKSNLTPDCLITYDNLKENK